MWLWSTNERQLLVAEVLKSLERLDAMMQYGALNYEGFRKILKKFDKRSGCAVSSSVLADRGQQLPRQQALCRRAHRA
jgi:SPX domain protein involved in polyphosphate accumulation